MFKNKDFNFTEWSRSLFLSKALWSLDSSRSGQQWCDALWTCCYAILRHVLYLMPSWCKLQLFVFIPAFHMQPYATDNRFHCQVPRFALEKWMILDNKQRYIHRNAFPVELIARCHQQHHTIMEITYICTEVWELFAKFWYSPCSAFFHFIVISYQLIST